MNRIALPLVLAVLLVAPTAQAKNLADRWGVGFTQGLATTHPDHTSLAVRYWLDSQLALEGRTGFSYAKRDEAPDDRSFSLGGRFLIKVVEEENLHAYGGAGISLLTERHDGNSDQGVGAEVFGGLEFFFQGLPHLGFSTELGLVLEEMGDRTDFRTDGGSFINLGIRYYF
ncbi:MAG: hypothetical protein P1P84_08590 [Deferrisomatales bacterium]|nr:hypothetical protein [Deferrisomatales bacterium]